MDWHTFGRKRSTFGNKYRTWWNTSGKKRTRLQDYRKISCRAFSRFVCGSGTVTNTLKISLGSKLNWTKHCTWILFRLTSLAPCTICPGVVSPFHDIRSLSNWSRAVANLSITTVQRSIRSLRPLSSASYTVVDSRTKFSLGRFPLESLTYLESGSWGSFSLLMDAGWSSHKDLLRGFRESVDAISGREPRTSCWLCI